MPIYRLPAQHHFPDPREAEPSGLLAVGGDLHPARVLTAYHLGIFPWFSEGDPLCWWSPDPRMVLLPDELTIPRSLGKRVRQGRFRITMDEAFADVIAHCSQRERPEQDGTWITDAMRDAYTALFDAGFAHSIEAWNGDRLVGGLYGVSVGDVFAGESMFALESDASKVAFTTFVRQFQRWGGHAIDCQMHTDHLDRFGARLLPRSTYLAMLPDPSTPPSASRWAFDEDFSFDGR